MDENYYVFDTYLFHDFPTTKIGRVLFAKQARRDTTQRLHVEFLQKSWRQSQRKRPRNGVHKPVIHARANLPHYQRPVDQNRPESKAS